MKYLFRRYAARWEIKMRKHISTLLSAVISCFFALMLFFLLWLVSSGNASSDISPIEFSESGDVLHFFGETLYISRDNVMQLLSYPSRASEFCMGFLPTSVAGHIRSFAQSLTSNCRSFLSLAFGALDAFFTLGTNL